MRRKTWLRGAIGLALLGVAFGVGDWVRIVQARRERAEGIKVAREAAALALSARDAAVAEPAKAEEALTRAISLLSGARGGASVPRASLLVDLASLRLARGPGEAASRRSARELLREAWSLPDVPTALKARIARDLGGVCVLDGDLPAAEGWYVAALRLAPDDGEAARRLRSLRETPSAAQAERLN